MANIFGTDGNDFFGRNDNPLTDDIFDMGAGNDFAFGNYGADTYLGGAGFDTVSYRFADEGVILNLATGGTVGMAAGDTYDSIERIFGSNFNDTITGDDFANFLYGGLGSDTINGGGGNDRIFGGEGSDTINGGAGNDFIEGGAGGDIIDGGDGIDTIGFSTFAPEQNDDIPNTEGVNINLNAPPPQAPPLNGDLGMDAEGDFYINIENVSGSNFDDNINGNDDANILNGRAGDDVLAGGLGNDRLIGGFGDDDLFGGDGADFLIGGSGQDHLFGGNDNDRLTGGVGDDFLFGGNGNDFMVGGDGNDEFEGGAGNDLIFLGNGEDLAQGGDGNDFFYLTNDGATDEIYGGTTDFEGGTTDNGYDTVSYVHATGGVEVFLGGLIFSPPPPAEARPLDEPLNMPVPESDFLIGIERVIGSNFDDAIYGGFGDEVIIGGNGGDILAGGGGRDRLIGGNGADTFEFEIGFHDTVSVLDFVQGVDQIIFRTFDDTLTEADILSTMVDFGNGVFVFEFGAVPDGPPVEQRFAVITGDSEIIPNLDDFTIEIIEDFPFPFDPPMQEPYAENAFTDVDMAAFADFDALI